MTEYPDYWIAYKRKRWVWFGPRGDLKPPYGRGETIIGYRDGHSWPDKHWFACSSWPQPFPLWLEENDEGDLKETREVKGRTIVGYVHERYVDCRVHGRAWCGHQYVGYPISSCIERTRIKFPSSPWGRCLFCGKSGKPGGRVISAYGFALCLSRWGSASKQTREDEVYGSADFESNSYICHGCNRRLDNLYNEFMDCDQLIKRIEKEQSDGYKTTSKDCRVDTVVNQDDARPTPVIDTDLRGHDCKAHHD